MIGIMSVLIAVSDPLPLFRSGIVATLGDVGFEPDAPADLLAWIRQDQRRVVFLTLQTAEDWSLLGRLREARADIVIVAVIVDTSTSAYVRAIHAGASAVVPRTATPDTIRRAFRAAVAGESILPLEVVRALAGGEELPIAEPESPAAREIEWLRQLGTGTTVAQLAQRAGYSERAMFRLLRDLYRRMGVSSRVEALIHAHQRGWL
jgi:DNA-binding NarL/FixJ family response regulator